jgi:hypothetical protein
MEAQKTAKQHYVPSSYLKAFADDNGQLRIFDLMHNRHLKPRAYKSVCYELFYYAMETGVEDETSQNFEKYFQVFEDRFAKQYDSIVYDIINNKQLSEAQLLDLALYITCLWLRSPAMRSHLFKAGGRIANLLIAEKINHPDFTKDAVCELAKDGITITEQQAEKFANELRSGKYQFTLTNWVHLVMIEKCKDYSQWLLAKNWRFHISKSSKQFITSDTPVIERHESEGGLFKGHILEREHFFVLTPNILIELSDPTKSNKRVKRRTITDAQVTAYNTFRANQSSMYCYSLNKSDLEDVSHSYHERSIVKKAVREYLQNNRSL